MDRAKHLVDLLRLLQLLYDDQRRSSSERKRPVDVS
jgi:hypothetical protein